MVIYLAYAAGIVAAEFFLIFSVFYLDDIKKLLVLFRYDRSFLFLYIIVVIVFVLLAIFILGIILSAQYLLRWLLCYYCMLFYYSIVWLLFILSFQLIHLILFWMSVYILNSPTLLKSILSHNYYLFLLLLTSFWLYNWRW